jgi:hypothetical protein
LAKLTGVKTLDMVNGEVTRVEYDGSVYERVFENAKDGDIGLRITDSRSFAKVGYFYPVINDLGLRFKDDEGDKPYLNEEKFALFRKEADTLESRVATLEEAVFATADPEPLKVGDYIVALLESDREYGITNTDMKLGKVVGKNDDGIQIEIIDHVDKSDIGDTYWVEPKYFRKATDEEVAEVTAETERKQLEEKWAKIGRKPNEFKKGDIVRVLTNKNGGAVPVGEVGAVDNVTGYNLQVMTANITRGNFYTCDDIELITPVEARFDVAN